MRKFFYLPLFFLITCLLIFGQTISDVRLQPSQSTYNAGASVKIYWNYTGLSIPSDALVKITLWREGSSQNICKIAENVRITTGSTGLRWTIPEKCTNPHTGAQENLTQGNLWVRVRWQRHNVWGESSKFTIKKDYTSLVYTSGILKQIFPEALTPMIYDIKIIHVKNHFYKVTWKYANIPPDQRFCLYLYKNNNPVCRLDVILVKEREALLSFMNLCLSPMDTKLIKKREGVYRLVFDFTDYTNYKDVKFYSQPINSLFFPELSISDISISTRRGRSYVLLIISVRNGGPAASSPFGLRISGRDAYGHTFTKTVYTNTGWDAWQKKSVAVEVPSKPFSWNNCCIKVTLIKNGVETNGYYPDSPSTKEKCFTPPHVVGHM